jgi:uncharacterized membrane protein
MEPTQNQEGNSLSPEGESVITENQKIEEAQSAVESAVPQSGSTPTPVAAESYLSSASKELKITLPTINAKKLYSICIGMFVASSLGAILALLLPIFGFMLFFWYVAFWCSLLLVVVLFFMGILQGFSSGKSFKLVGTSLLFFVVLFLVGAGTCAVNFFAVASTSNGF